MKMRNGFVSNSSSSSYLIYLPRQFDILSTGITEDDLSRHEISLDELLSAMITFKEEGEIQEDSIGYQLLYSKLEPFQIFSFEGGPNCGMMYILTDAEKCRLVRFLIADGLASEPSELSEMAKNLLSQSQTVSKLNSR